jgi:DNA-binding CsgD family transcriptional regulator
MAKTTASLDDLLLQSRITNRLLAARLKTQMQQNELVALLAGTGASAQDIADILGTTAGTISTTLTRLRKKGKVS